LLILYHYSISPAIYLGSFAVYNSTTTPTLVYFFNSNNITPSFVVYFFVVVPLNYLLAKVKKPEAVAEPTTKPCPECLSDIPLGARRCKFCTAQLAA